MEWLILILFTSAFCIKYETLLLSSSIAILSNPINKFIRYTTTKRENKTINTAIDGFSVYVQLDNALESPIDKKNCLKILENIMYIYIIMKNLNIPIKNKYIANREVLISINMFVFPSGIWIISGLEFIFPLLSIWL